MKKKTVNSEEKLLLTKIAGYSTLVGVAMLLSPSAAKGDIVYVNPADITISLTSSFYNVDLNSDGEADIRFENDNFNTSSSYSMSVQYNTTSTTTTGGGITSTYDIGYSYYNYNYGSSRLYLNSVNSNSVITSSSSVVPIGSGITLTNNGNWQNGSTFTLAQQYNNTSSVTTYQGSYNISSSSQADGPWAPTVSNKYIGIKFDIDGDDHLGWVRISVICAPGDSKIIIHDWAYESVAGASITTGATETPTPIELSNFTAMEENGAIRLNWETASETENSGYVIQRKITNGAWENLTDFHSDPTLEGHGTTSESHSYSWLDENVLPGSAYQYRLGDIDHANKTVWHDVVEITVSEETANIPGEFGLQTAFPNPFNPQLTIRYGLTEDAQTLVRILNLQGKVISTLENKFQKAGSYELQWQAGDNASGVYLVEVVSGEKSDLRKVLLTK